jgi:hypothetical protein
MTGAKSVDEELPSVMRPHEPRKLPREQLPTLRKN